MSAAAIIVLRRKRFIRAFREAGATDRHHAVTLEQLGQRPSWIFDQMVRRGVFITTADGLHFMDERAAAEFLAAQRRRAWVLTGALLLVWLMIWLLGLMKS